MLAQPRSRRPTGCGCPARNWRARERCWRSPARGARPGAGVPQGTGGRVSELPAELVDVAAAAGVRWPEADETAMESSAGAWRRAARQLSSLCGDADTGARFALNAFDGEAADAARRHWDRYVREDGRLTVAIRECTAAADRLEHGAREVAAAKLEII